MSTNRKNENMICSIRKKATIPDQKFIDSTMKKLERTVELFEKEYNEKIYTIKFTNGERITFEIKKGALAHLLGLEIYKIKRTNLYKKESDDFLYSYKYLNKILENPVPLQTLNQHRNGDLVNYRVVRQKCLAFENLYKLHEFEFLGIDFDINKFPSRYPTTRLKSDKLLVYASSEKDISYFMLGLAKDPVTMEPYAETLITNYRPNISSKHDPKSFLEDQKIMLPSKITTEKYYDEYNSLVKMVDESFSKEEVMGYLIKLKEKINLTRFQLDDEDYEQLSNPKVLKMKRAI